MAVFRLKGNVGYVPIGACRILIYVRVLIIKSAPLFYEDNQVV
jgi:hypothetical protein